MKSVLIKTLIVAVTLTAVLLILLVSCSRPVYEQRAELEIVSAYCEPEPQLLQVSTQSSEPKAAVLTEKVPKTTDNEITQTPESFLASFETDEVIEARELDVSDEFLEEFQVYQEKKFKELFAQDATPLPIVQDVLEFMEGAVGGHYIFGSQGDILTVKLIYDTNRLHPNYLNSGRLAYFVKNAVFRSYEGELSAEYPTDYAWDCSGLWWDCVNELEIFDRFTDRTAAETFEEFCTPIEKNELVPGDLVFYRLPEGRISHMGIVGYDGYVYEAASGFVGVVKTQSLDVRIYEDIVRGGHLVFPNWNEFGRPTVYK